MRNLKGYAKFFAKIYVVGAVRSVILYFIGRPPNRDGWEKRVLIINLDLIGDLAMFTSVLKHYKKALPGKEICLLINTGAGINSSTGMSVTLLAPFVDRVLGMSAHKFIRNPIVAAKTIQDLRAIGFQTVIDHQPGVTGIIEKMVTVNLGAEKVVGYEGLPVELARPVNVTVELAGKYVRKYLFPRYTKIVKSIEGPYDPAMKRFPNFIRYYDAIFEDVIGCSVPDNIPVLCVDVGARGRMGRLLDENNLAVGSYCLMAVGTSAAFKQWEIKKFAGLARALRERNIPVIVVGSASERVAAEEFKQHFGGDFFDFTGRTSVDEFIALAEMSFLCVGNDSSISHIAVALKKPSLIMLGLGHFGMLSLYGYQDINRWVYAKDEPCLCDNWECCRDISSHSVCPCVSAISLEQAREEMLSLIKHISSAARLPQEAFRVEF